MWAAPNGVLKNTLVAGPMNAMAIVAAPSAVIAFLRSPPDVAALPGSFISLPYWKGSFQFAALYVLASLMSSAIIGKTNVY